MSCTGGANKELLAFYEQRLNENRVRYASEKAVRDAELEATREGNEARRIIRNIDEKEKDAIRNAPYYGGDTWKPLPYLNNWHVTVNFMKKIIYLCFLPVFIVVCCSCSLFEGSELVFEQEYYDDSLIGRNEIGTAVNIAVEYDDWIYYRDNDDRLYRSRPDDNIGSKLTNDSLRGFCITQNWIYYTNYSDKGSIFKMRPNGTEREKINNEYSHLGGVSGGWIYYTASGDGCVYKIRVDGSDKTKITNEKVDTITLGGDWIYYKPSDDYRYRKMRPNGTESAVLTDEPISSVQMVDGVIYYIDKSDNGGSICKMNTGGTEKTKINDEWSADFSVSGDWIYYCKVTEYYHGDRPTNGHLYKIRTDGTERTLVSETYCPMIDVVDEWIYYKSGGLLKMHTDGSDVQKLGN